MRKALAFGIASICTLGFAGGVFADPITSEGDTLIDVTYDVSPAYTITVPAGIIFSSTNTSVNESVKAENVLINDSETLKVSMKSANGNLINGTDSYIPYSYKLGEAATVDIAADTDYELLSIESGDKSGETKSLVFTAGGLDNVTLAGLHADTLTFKVEIDDGIAFMQDIDATMKAKIASGEITVLKDKQDNKKYSVAKIGDNYWMTSNLKNTDNDDGTSWNDGILAAESGEVYYNWDAAKTACPQGWKLPTDTQFNNLISTASLTKDNISSDPFYGVRAGGVGNGNINDVGIGGYYWSSTEKDDNNAYNLNFGGSNMGVSGRRKTDGYSVRCVAE